MGPVLGIDSSPMDAGVFAGLVTDRKAIADVCRAIEAAVTTSFVQDRARGGLILVTAPTQAETKRRANKCIEIFRVLRGDLKWSWQRAADHLTDYLRKDLDGEHWEPEAKRASWVTAAKRS